MPLVSAGSSHAGNRSPSRRRSITRKSSTSSVAVAMVGPGRSCVQVGALFLGAPLGSAQDERRDLPGRRAMRFGQGRAATGRSAAVPRGAVRRRSAGRW